MVIYQACISCAAYLQAGSTRKNMNKEELIKLLQELVDKLQRDVDNKYRPVSAEEQESLDIGRALIHLLDA